MGQTSWSQTTITTGALPPSGKGVWRVVRGLWNIRDHSALCNVAGDSSPRHKHMTAALAVLDLGRAHPRLAWTDPQQGEALTFCQCQHSSLAPHVPQGKHGPVAVKQFLGLIQEDLPELGNIRLLSRGSRIYREVWAGAWLLLVALQPLQPPHGQLTRLCHLWRQGHGPGCRTALDSARRTPAHSRISP